MTTQILRAVYLEEKKKILSNHRMKNTLFDKKNKIPNYNMHKKT